ncbi:MAG: hypothetical protein WC455_13640 [Dehalococcoidia bacterium]|jgi:hypothetical protein
MNNHSSTKWIISLGFTITIAVAGWIFGGVNMKSAADHRLLIAQDELLYQREEQNTKLNAIQQDRIDKLEQKMDVFGIKLDQILILLRGKQ